MPQKRSQKKWMPAGGRIPVYTHNVANGRIFRPSSWQTFDTQCLEGADYRACANFGPLYA